MQLPHGQRLRLKVLFIFLIANFCHKESCCYKSIGAIRCSPATLYDKLQGCTMLLHFQPIRGLEIISNTHSHHSSIPELLKVHKPWEKLNLRGRTISFLVKFPFLVWALKVHKPYISHQIARVASLAAYFPLVTSC